MNRVNGAGLAWASPSSRSGRVMGKILALVVVCGLALSTIYYFLGQVRRTKQCEAHLLKIYRALEYYELDRGTLPNLAFFPGDPKEDKDSLRVVLESYGVDADACTCPAVPALLGDAGLTYVWNLSLNGKKMPRLGDPTWMLVDITALSADVPAPHMGHQNALYSDGKVRKIKTPLRDLKGL